MTVSLFDLSLYPLGPLFWGGEQFSWMSDCRARGEAEQSTTLPQHNLHCGWVWLQSGCSGGKTAQGEGRVLLQLGVTAACFSVCDIPNVHVHSLHFSSHQFYLSFYSDRQALSITLSRSITVFFTASPCRMRFCVIQRSCRKSLNVWWKSTRMLHSRESSSGRNNKTLLR